MQQDIQQNSWKHSAGVAAAQLIEDGMVIGLGSGSTATHLVYALAQRLQTGLRIVGAVPTSNATGELANSLGIPLTTLDAHPQLDLVIDGADEIDSQLNLIKGGGGALLREKIVASTARRFVIVGDITKLVPILGKGFALPVEIVPFALAPVQSRLETLGITIQVRKLGNQVYITDNGNMIVDCIFPQGITDPFAIHTRMKSIVGVVETGLFLGMAEQAIIGGPEGVKVLYASS
ncbi:MAG: ribose-5-phosphate isomerase RpiA [Ktedonobacteraceae bacterium]